MLMFCVGCLIGGFCGVVLLALFVGANRRDE